MWKISLKYWNKKLIYLTIQFSLYQKHFPRLYMYLLELVRLRIRSIFFTFKKIYENSIIIIKTKSFKTPKQSPITWLATVNKFTKLNTTVRINERYEQNAH